MPGAERLPSHVYWIGGGSGAGKSTLARHLADLTAGEVYSTDAAHRPHTEHCRDDDCPLLTAFKGMTMDERWADRSPQVMLDTFQWFQGECFEMIVDDLRRYPADRPVFAEGFRLLPKLVEPYLASGNHGIWLLPTPQFRRLAFEKRGTLWTIANKTTKPEQALQNLLTRDMLFTDQLASDVERLGLKAQIVDGSLSEDQSVNALAAHFGLA